MKKIGKMLKFVWDWLVYSSANAEKISMTVKSIGIAVIPALLIAFHTFNIQLGSEELTVVVNELSSLVIMLGGLVSIIGVILGIFRKIFMTLSGTNDVVAQYKANN